MDHPVDPLDDDAQRAWHPNFIAHRVALAAERDDIACHVINASDQDMVYLANALRIRARLPGAVGLETFVLRITQAYTPEQKEARHQIYAQIRVLQQAGDLDGAHALFASPALAEAHRLPPKPDMTPVLVALADTAGQSLDWLTLENGRLTQPVLHHFPNLIFADLDEVLVSGHAGAPLVHPNCSVNLHLPDVSEEDLHVLLCGHLANIRHLSLEAVYPSDESVVLLANRIMDGTLTELRFMAHNGPGDSGLSEEHTRCLLRADAVTLRPDGYVIKDMGFGQDEADLKTHWVNERAQMRHNWQLGQNAQALANLHLY
jgi:hypothetical protein